MKPIFLTSIRIPAIKLLCAAGLAIIAALPAAAAQGQKTIAIAVKVAGDPWWARLEEGLKEFNGAHPDLHIFMQGVSRSDGALQAQLIEDLIAQKPDAIGIVPISPQTLEPVIAKAQAAGIKVVMHEGETQPTKDFDVEAFDNAAYGRHLMDELAKGMGEEGEYAVFVGKLTNVSHNQWVDAAVEYQKQKYPKMKMVGTKNESNEDAATAYRKAQELLVAYPNIKGFQGSSSNDPVGIGQGGRGGWASAQGARSGNQPAFAERQPAQIWCSRVDQLLGSKARRNGDVRDRSSAAQWSDGQGRRRPRDRGIPPCCGQG